MATVAVPIAISCIKSKSISPITGAMNVSTITTGVARTAGGYVAGYAAGLVIDKVGLKRPVNKALKFVGMR